MARKGFPLNGSWAAISLPVAFLISGCLSLGEEGSEFPSFEEIFQKEYGASPESLKSVLLDGVAQRLESASPVTTTDTFSVAVWVKPTVAAQAPYAAILSAGVETHFALSVDEDQAAYQFAVKSPAAARGEAKGGTIEAGQWQFIVGTYNGTKGRIYVNGVKVGEDDFDAFGQETSTLAVGSTAGGGGPNWEGGVDEVALWSTTLSDAEVASLYSGGKPKILVFGNGDYRSQKKLSAWWTMGDQVNDNSDTIVDLLNLTDLTGFGLAPSSIVSDAP